MTDTSDLLAALFPASYRSSLTPEEAEWVRRKYKLWYVLDALWAFALWPLLTILLAIPLHKVYSLYHAANRPDETVFICNWHVIAAALCVFCGVFAMHPWVHRLLLGKWYTAFVWKVEQKYGYDWERTLRFVCILFGVVGVIPIIAVFPLATKATSSTITNVSVFGLDKQKVNIADISKVTRYRTTQLGDNIRYTPVFVFTLKNGTQVNTGNWVADYEEMDGFIKQQKLLIDSAELFRE